MSKLQSKLEELVRNLHYAEQEERDNTVGKVLTIIDASFADPEQRKAVKDLMRNVFYSNRYPGDESTMQRHVRQLGETEGVHIFANEAGPNASVGYVNAYEDIK